MAILHHYTTILIVLSLVIVLLAGDIAGAWVIKWSNLIFAGDGEDNMYNGLILSDGTMIWGITTQSYGVSYTTWYNGAYLWTRINNSGGAEAASLIELSSPIVVYDLAFIPGLNYTVAVGSDNYWRAVIIVVDYNGSVVGVYTLKPASSGIYYYYLTQVDYAPDGTLVFTGTYVTTSYRFYAWITKTDTSLNILSSTAYQILSSVAWAQAFVDNTTLAVAGYRYYDPPWIMLVNYTDMSVESAVTIGYSRDDRILDLYADNGTLYYAGYLDNNSGDKGIVGALDSSLSPQWATIIESSSSVSLNGITVDSLGRIAVVGYYDSSSSNNSLVIGIDNSGSILWSYTLGGQFTDTWFYTVASDQNSIVVMGGARNSTTGMNTWAVSLDASGREVIGCGLSSSTPLSSSPAAIPVTSLTVTSTDVTSTTSLTPIPYTVTSLNVNLSTLCYTAGGCIYNAEGYQSRSGDAYYLGAVAGTIALIIVISRRIQ